MTTLYTREALLNRLVIAVVITRVTERD